MSIEKNFDNFCFFLETVSYHPIVIGPTETWLKSNQNGPHNNLQNYDFYFNSRTLTKSGGFGLYVRSSTTYWQRRDLSVF